MNASDMITELNDHGFSDESTTAKVRSLQHAVYDIEGREPWPFIEAVITLTFDGTNSYPSNMPTNYRALLNAVDMATAQKIRWVRSEEFDSIVGNQQGLPQTAGILLMYWDGSHVNFWPVPSASATVRMRYQVWSPAISSGSLETDFKIPAQYHDIIVAGALWRLYEMNDDPDLAARWEQHVETRLAAMRATMQRLQFSRPDVIRITDYDDIYGDF